MKCEYSDVINPYGANELGWSMNDMFARFMKYWNQINYPINKGETGDKAIWLNVDSNPALTPEQIVSNLKYAGIRKCKHPRNEECDSDAQCPHKNRCELGRCRGQQDALCVSDMECDSTKGLTCQMTMDINDYGYGKTYCKGSSKRLKKTVSS